MPSTHTPRRWRQLVGLAAFALAATSLLAAAPTASAAAHTVSGIVYWDQNNDGRHQPSEPGVPGIRVHSSSGNGTPSTVTAADGTYVLAGVPAKGALTVETGWFRSQCSKMSCPVGPGPDNDFPTSNQFIKRSLTSLTGDLTDLDVGLLPDWPGSKASAPAPVGGVVAANTVDVAARLSWVKSTCAGGTLNICSIGDTFTVSGQIHNQGTKDLTGLRAVLWLPGTDRFSTTDPAGSISLTTTATSPGITGLQVEDVDNDARTVHLRFTGTLVAGGLIKLTAKARVAQGPGTPGCLVAHPTTACEKGEPQGAALLFAVTHLDQSGDPDSFDPSCDPIDDVAGCATGLHDKHAAPDEVDPVGHNVSAGPGVTSAFNLRTSTHLLGTPPKAGGRFTTRVSVANTGPTMVGSGWTLTALFDKGASPTVPKSNAARKCSKATTAQGYPMVRCTGKVPLSPGVTSPAFDLVSKVPSSVKSQGRVRVLAFVEPNQSGETIPLGVAPIAPSSPVASDNDALCSVTVG